MKMLTIELLESELPANISDVVATSWEIAVYPNFKVENYIIGRMLESTVNRTSLDMAIDETKLVNKNVFYRYKHHYADNSTEDWCDYKTLNIEDAPLPSISSIIEIPNATSKIVYREEGDVLVGYLCVNTSTFRDYSGVSAHHKTLCTVTNNIGTVLYSSESIKTETIEQGNLNYFEIPVGIFDDNDIYTVNISYTSSNGIVSGTLNHKYESFLKDNAVTEISDYVSGEKVTNLSKGRVAYFKVVPQTTKFVSVNMQLKDDDSGLIVSENLDQETIYPKLYIPGDLDSEKVYKVMSSVNLIDGNSSTPVPIISLNIEDTVLRTIDTNATYKDKYSYMGYVENSGLSVQSTEQLDDGHILLANNQTKSIDMYKVVAEQLEFVKTVISLPSYEDLAMMNINIVKLYNGKILLNYGAKNKNIYGQEQVFNLYDYNAGNQKFSLVNQTRVSDMGESTGLSSSLFVAPNNDVYFIPAIKYDVNNEKELLKLWRLDANTFTVSIAGNLPFNAIRYVSIVPTSDPAKFAILSGSTNEFNIDGRIVWKRENNSVYEYNTSNGVFSNLNIDISSLPEEMYNVQAYLRKDGKVILFNSSKSGTTIDDQNTAIIDLSAKTVNLLNNDLPDNMIYRSTVVMNNGEFIRVVSNSNHTHSVYRYVGNSLNTVNAPIIENRTADFVVPAGETRTLDHLGIYSKIVIEGSDMDDTGTLISTDKGLPGEFYYNTLIIASDVVLNSSEYNGYENVIIINDSNVQFMD